MFNMTKDTGSVKPWLLGLTVISLALRLVNLDSGLWIDEISSLVNQYRLPVADVFTNYIGDNQHPLYAVLASVSVSVFGEHAWSIRLPAVLFGVASVPALYLLGAEVSNRREGLLSAALLTFSYHHVWFSQNARGYTALALSAILASFYFVRLLHEPKTRDVWLYGLIAALGCYAHLTMVFVVVGHFLIYLLVQVFPDEQRRGPTGWKHPFAGLVLAGVMTLLLYGPIVGQVVDYFVNSPSPLQDVSTPMWALIEATRSLSIGFGTGLVVVVAAIMALVGVASYLRTNPVALGLFILPIMVTIVGAFLARGTMYPRFFFALIGFSILIGVRGVMVAFGWGARRLFHGNHDDSRSLGVATAVIVFGILMSALSLTRNYQYPKMDFQGARIWVEAQAAPEDRIVTVGAAAWPYRFYYETGWPQLKVVADLYPQLADDGSVWVVYAFGRYLAISLPEVMAAIRRDCVDEKRFHGTLGNGDVIVCRMLQN